MNRVVRGLSFAEGLSYLVLVGFGMPMKYLAHDPSWVRMLGSLHGGLFVLLALACAWAMAEAGWSLRRVGWVMGWGLVPLGAFHVERVLRREAAQSAASASAKG